LSLLMKIKHLYFHDSGYPPLCLAAFLYDREVIEWLLWLGCDANVRDKIDSTPIFDAICNPDIEVLRCLVKSGADVNVQNKFGNTALMHAVFQGGQIDKIKILLAAGANTTLKNDKGMSAMDYAVRNEQKQIIELF
jgi:ankyrin repeat protein